MEGAVNKLKGRALTSWKHRMARTLRSSKVNAKSCSWDRVTLCCRTAWGLCLGGSSAKTVLEDKKVSVQQQCVLMAKADCRPAVCAGSGVRGWICPSRSTAGTPPGCGARFGLPGTGGGWGGGLGGRGAMRPGREVDPSLGAAGRKGPDPSRKSRTEGDRDRGKREPAPSGSGETGSGGCCGPGRAGTCPRSPRRPARAPSSPPRRR